MKSQNQRSLSDIGNGFFWKTTFLFLACAAGMFIHVNYRLNDEIRQNMYAAQKMVEDYAMHHDGYYPDDAYFCQLVAESELENPYSAKINTVVPVIPKSQNLVGSVGYLHDGFNRSPYQIYGRERKGLILDPDGSIFILSGP